MFKIYKLGDFGVFDIEKILSLEDSIDFHPDYQRYGGIWSKEKKQLFIDTILNDFDTPKFYFNYFSSSKNPLNINDKLYAVIDGKQRLEAIFDFVNNKFGLSDSFIFQDQESINLKGVKFDEIAREYPFVLSKFLSYELDIIFVDTDDGDKLEEMFLRLNGGIALTNAEKRNAIGGEFNKKIRELVETHIFFTRKVRFKNPRYQHQDLLIKLLLIESQDNLVSFKNNTLDDFIRNNKNYKEDITQVLEATRNNLNDLANCFEDNDPLLASKGIIPVYYYFFTRHAADSILFYRFLIAFEEVRKENRRKDSFEASSVLIDYDRLNQQGVHLEKSLKFRYKVIEKGYNHFKKYESLENFSIGESLNYEYDEDNIITT